MAFKHLKEPQIAVPVTWMFSSREAEARCLQFVNLRAELETLKAAWSGRAKVR